MLLESTLPTIYNRAQDLSDDLQALKDISDSLQKDKELARQSKVTLSRKQNQIKELVEKRETIYRATKSDYDRQKQVTARLAKEAKTLMQLIDKLEKERARTANISNRKYVMPEAGQSQLPVTGFIVTAFNQKDEIGARSQGIRIETQPGSMAISPMGGIVRFAGAFKNYGNMVIIEHKNGYHSLISGMKSVNIAVDHAVKAGEPIGQMPVASSRGDRPRLYYELRFNGKPIDPAQRISDLKT
jgi:septal ring factor EnvC (AmiA/AmiB activator)